MGVFDPRGVQFRARHEVVVVVCVFVHRALVVETLAVRGGGGGAQIDELAVVRVLHEAVHVGVAGVVPYPLRAEIHGEGVGGVRIVREGVGGVVAAAADVAADEADPEVLVGVAGAALV